MIFVKGYGMTKNKSVICPICGSSNVGEYLFGYPAYSYELEEKVNNGEIILGGCCIAEDSPKYHCNECEEDFGKYLSDK